MSFIKDNNVRIAAAGVMVKVFYDVKWIRGVANMFVLFGVNTSVNAHLLEGNSLKILLKSKLETFG